MVLWRWLQALLLVDPKDSLGSYQDSVVKLRNHFMSKATGKCLPMIKY